MRPPVIATAYGTRSAMKVCATRPCSESAAMVCAVMLAWAFAWVITNRNGLAAAFTSATVSETAHRSAGEGRTGISTRSARPSTVSLCSEIVGGVSMKQ